MKPSEILKKARDLIINKGWTQGAYAREGAIPVPYDSEYADSFCTMGSIYSVAMGLKEWYEPAVMYLKRAIRTDTIAHWNDYHKRTKEQVIAAFDKAIEMAESEGS